MSPRIYRRAKSRRAGLTPAWERFFAEGREASDSPEPGESKWGVMLESYRHEAVWREHRDAFLADWVAESPGTRPYAWWRWEAPAPRRCVAGAELLDAAIGDWWWRPRFGEPAFVQCRPRGYEGLPMIEGEGAYLTRLGLLLPGERPDTATLEPEEVDPFLTYAGEVDALEREYATRWAAGAIGPTWQPAHHRRNGAQG